MYNQHIQQMQYEQYCKDLARQVQEGYATQALIMAQMKRLSNYFGRAFVALGTAIMPQSPSRPMQMDPS